MMRFEVKGAPEQVQWPQATSQAWNYMRQVEITSSVLKRPDIGLSDRFLIASILCQPADQRPWGIVTWLADFYQTTRQTIYTIANSILYPFVIVEPTDQGTFSSNDQSAKGQLPSEALSAPDHRVERAIAGTGLSRLCINTSHARDFKRNSWHNSFHWLYQPITFERWSISWSIFITA